MLSLKTQLISGILVLSLTSNIAFAADTATCPNSVVLHVGDTVKDCDRVGFSLGFEKTLRKQIVESEYDQKIIDEQKTIMDLKDLSIKNISEQSNLWKAEADRERSEVDKMRDRERTSFWIGMGVGVLTILAGAWTVKQVAR